MLFSGSRTTHPESTTRRALVLGLLPPFVCRAVRWSSGLYTNVRGISSPHSGLCKVSQAFFQAVELLRHFWRHNVFVCLIFARCTSQVHRRFRGVVEDVIQGLQHAYLEAHCRLCPIDLGRNTDLQHSSRHQSLPAVSRRISRRPSLLASSRRVPDPLLPP